MVTGIRQKRAGRKQPLYITEWMAHRGLSDQDMAERLDTDRTTVWRWRTQQHRLDPGKIAAIAAALNIEPKQLWDMPDFVSLDAIAKDVSVALKATAAEIIRSLVKAGTGE